MAKEKSLEDFMRDLLARAEGELGAQEPDAIMVVAIKNHGEKTSVLCGAMGDGQGMEQLFRSLEVELLPQIRMKMLAQHLGIPEELMQMIPPPLMSVGNPMMLLRFLHQLRQEMATAEQGAEQDEIPDPKPPERQSLQDVLLQRGIRINGRSRHEH